MKRELKRYVRKLRTKSDLAVLLGLDSPVELDRIQIIFPGNINEKVIKKERKINIG
jgi:hypothetical protein